MLGLAFGKLAHIFHRNLLSVCFSVNPLGQVADASIFHPDERMGYDLYLGYLGQMHRQIFILGQHCKAFRLRLEDKITPKTHNREFLGILVLIQIQRQFGLDAGQGGLRLDNLGGKFVHLRTRIIQ